MTEENPPIDIYEDLGEFSSRPQKKLSSKAEFRLDALTTDQHSKELTATANGRRFFKEHGHQIKYVSGMGWVVWDGFRFKRDPEGSLVRELARDYAHKRFMFCSSLATDSAGQEKVKHRYIADAIKLDGSKYLNEIVGVLHDCPGTIIDHAALDSNGFHINCLNGVLDLMTGELLDRQAAKDGLATKIIPVEYSPESESELWEKFLLEIMPNEETLYWIRMCAGYSLTGVVRDHALFYCYGLGLNGKSTFLNAMQAAMGEYSLQIDSDILLDSEKHPTSRASLRGARLVVASEPENKKMATSVIKSLTGGDAIPARFMRQDEFRFFPSHKMWMAANHKPQINDTDDGIWRRVKIVPFETKIDEASKDTGLPEKLKNELPAILAWMVRGCLDWVHESQTIGECPAVLQATQEHRRDSDQVGEFLENFCCEIQDKTRTKTLFDAFKSWVEFEGAKYQPSPKWFGSQMANHGHKIVKSMGQRYFQGIGLSTEWYNVESEITAEKASKKQERGYSW